MSASHPYAEVDAHDGAGLAVEVDTERPGSLLISTISDGSDIETVSIDATRARGFATAIRHLAERVDPTPAFSRGTN